MFKDKRVKLLIFLSLMAGVLLGIKLIIPKEITPELIETSPKDNQGQIKVTSSLIFSFNQPVKPENFNILAFPNFKYSITNKDDYSLEIKPILLEYDTSYQVELKNNKFESFYVILKFKTEKIPEVLEYNKEEVREFYEQLEKQTYTDYPLFDYIPYYGEKFSVDYLKPLVLEVILKADTPEIRQEVLNWIKNKKVDPGSHKIEWKVKP
jgi:hypothetical protein